MADPPVRNKEKRSSVTEGTIVRAGGAIEKLGILSIGERVDFPDDFKAKRTSVEYQAGTDVEVTKVVADKLLLDNIPLEGL